MIEEKFLEKGLSQGRMPRGFKGYVCDKGRTTCIRKGSKLHEVQSKCLECLLSGTSSGACVSLFLMITNDLFVDESTERDTCRHFISLT